MANDWIIDVLADLKAYATKNGLSALAAQLDDASLVAAAEITSLDDGGPETADWNVGDIERDHRWCATRARA